MSYAATADMRPHNAPRLSRFLMAAAALALAGNVLFACANTSSSGTDFGGDSSSSDSSSSSSDSGGGGDSGGE